jgi:hypothetical protein
MHVKEMLVFAVTLDWSKIKASIISVEAAAQDLKSKSDSYPLTNEFTCR